MTKTVENEQTSMKNQSHNQESCLDYETRIAEIAYYKAEKRGFEPDHELTGWLEAEQEFILNEDKRLKV